MTAVPAAMDGAASSVRARELKDAVRRYWNEHLHDLAVTSAPIGSEAFFQELAAYRFGKLDYLPRWVDFDGFRGQRLLDVGCGLGIDLARFARGGARVYGVDLASRPLRLARQHFAQQGVSGILLVMDGEAMAFPDATFDFAYAHGVLQYTPDPAAMVAEIYRVLRPGGKALLMVYNRYSWLPAISRLTGVPLEHRDAPVWRALSIREFRALLQPFRLDRLVAERFPVPTRLHRGLKATLYNRGFVGLFRRLPRRWVQPLGWHLLAFVTKV